MISLVVQLERDGRVMPHQRSLHLSLSPMKRHCERVEAAADVLDMISVLLAVVGVGSQLSRLLLDSKRDMRVASRVVTVGCEVAAIDLPIGPDVCASSIPPQH
jgi:hypothetical protein